LVSGFGCDGGISDSTDRDELSKILVLGFAPSTFSGMWVGYNLDYLLLTDRRALRLMSDKGVVMIAKLSLSLQLRNGK